MVNAAVAAWLAPAPVGGPDAREAARRELERGEYHRDDPSLLERAADWVQDRLDDLLSAGGGSHAIVLLAAIAIAVVVALAVRNGALGSSRTAVPDDAADPLAPDATAADHRRLAERMATEGRRAEALREWLRAAVRTIEERGVLPPRPGRTGAATAREAGPLLPGAAAALSAATTAFDEVWFGGRTATDADVRVGRAAADAVASARIARGAASVDDLVLPW